MKKILWVRVPDTYKSPRESISEYETERHLVKYMGRYTENKELGWVTFTYDVYYSSFSCSVVFTYMPISGKLEIDEDSETCSCDVDVHAGGDCVGIQDSILCIQAAAKFHEYHRAEVCPDLHMLDG